MFKNKYFVANLAAQLIVFLSNMIINFYLTPYVVEVLGTEAYGFIGLINTVVGYVSIVTVALNSLAGRYITLAYHRGDTEAAKEYYSSVFFANLLMSVILFVLSVVITANISQILNVPVHLESDVKMAVYMSAANTVISLLSVVFGVAAFIKNQLYMNSLAQMVAAIIRVGTIILLFAFLEQHLWYYALSACLAALVTMLIQKWATNKLCPEFRIRPQYLHWNRVMEIVKSGIWISLENLNKIMQTGLDLLITNIFVDPVATGLLSIAKTVPNALKQLTSVFSSVFHPELARLYAEEKQEEMKATFNFSLRFLSMLLLVPLVGFVVFGTDFYRLWLPEKTEEEISLIQTLSVFSVLPLLVNSVMEVLYYANTLTNKIKGSVLISFVFSSLGVVTTVILLKATDIMPLYIIVATSALFVVARCLLITPLYAAYVLRLPKTAFFGTLLLSLVVAAVIFGLYTIVERCVVVDSWLEMLVQCSLCGIAGYLFVFCALFDSRERQEVIALLKRILRRK